MSSYFAPWSKYATFRGRARRAEYWTFTLINTVIYAVLIYLYQTSQTLEWTYAVLGFAVIVFLPSLAVLIRRLHDTGRSGAWFFIALVPFIGGLWLFILTLLGGQHGANEYGEDPRLVGA